MIGKGGILLTVSPDNVPNGLHDGPVTLRFEGVVEPTGHPELVPFYHFKILDESGEIVGHINFRVGETRHVKLCAGHIGYEILPGFRGHSYSMYACRAMSPFILQYYKKVLLTVEADNAPSIRILEKLGARFLDEVDVPADDPGYAKGARRKKRYEWVLDG